MTDGTDGIKFFTFSDLPRCTCGCGIPNLSLKDIPSYSNELLDALMDEARRCLEEIPDVFPCPSPTVGVERYLGFCREQEEMMNSFNNIIDAINIEKDARARRYQD